MDLTHPQWLTLLAFPITGGELHITQIRDILHTTDRNLSHILQQLLKRELLERREVPTCPGRKMTRSPYLFRLTPLAEHLRSHFVWEDSKQKLVLSFGSQLELAHQARMRRDKLSSWLDQRYGPSDI